MKILHVITSLQTGGAEKLVTDIVPMLRLKGLDVDVCLFDGQETAFKKRLEKSGCRIYSFSNGGNVYNPMNILRLTRLMRHYDVVHTHNTAPQNIPRPIDVAIGRGMYTLTAGCINATNALYAYPSRQKRT